LAKEAFEPKKPAAMPKPRLLAQKRASKRAFAIPPPPPQKKQRHASTGYKAAQADDLDSLLASAKNNKNDGAGVASKGGVWRGKAGEQARVQTAQRKPPAKAPARYARPAPARSRPVVTADEDRGADQPAREMAQAPPPAAPSPGARSSAPQGAAAAEAESDAAPDPLAVLKQRIDRIARAGNIDKDEARYVKLLENLRDQARKRGDKGIERWANKRLAEQRLKLARRAEAQRRSGAKAKSAKAKSKSSAPAAKAAPPQRAENKK